MSDALLPCPFCGKPAYIWAVPGYVQSSTFKVSCESDCVSMPARRDTFFTSRAEAAKAWNRRASPAPDALREALNRLVDIAEAYSADQSNAPHPMCANIQPVTVAEATELNEALQQARAALRSGDGWVSVKFTGGSDGEWTCSGCKMDWVCEAETPEENGYKFCPGCGGRIFEYVPYKDQFDEDDTLPAPPEDRT